ncbi:MAG: hypothetical protein DCF27_13880 [Lysobacteraceae bacterium]|nr:MAG: hypothetical protein DCF27_13880 [Xanthomonadaceae bacterium]
MTSVLQAIGWAVGLVWASPVTALGLMAGLVALPFGAKIAVSDAAVVFHRFPWGPGGAMTLGNVILHTGGSMDETTLTYACRAGLASGERVRLGDHERAHVLQYLALGPLFLPMYFACGGIHHGNRFEQAADRYALTGRGWWPWPRPGAAKPPD